MRTRLRTAGAAVALTLGTASLPVVATADVPEQALPDTAADEERRFGDHRYATAADMAVSAFPTGADVAVIARGDDFPDALAASYVARVVDGPILLTRSTSIPMATLDALNQLDTSTIVLVGGEAAISGEVEQAFKDRQGTDSVHRIDGADRESTAAAAAQFGEGRVGTAPDLSGQTSQRLRTAILAFSRDFPDAMSGGPLAYGGTLPVLLTGTDQLPLITEFTLQDGDLSIEQVIVVGGEAVVSDDVVKDVEDLGISVTRVAGPTRDATAAQMAEVTMTSLGWTPDTAALALGADFPDALALAPLAAIRQAPLFLAPSPDLVRANTFNGLQALCGELDTLLVAGGAAAVADDTVNVARLATSCADHLVPLSANAEVDGPGDPQDSGAARIFLTDDNVCWSLDVDTSSPVTGAHIHEGAIEVNGPVVATLEVPDRTGFAAGCVDVDQFDDATALAEFAQALAQAPEDFYVNVHTEDVPAGAIRGQVAIRTDLQLFGDAEVDDGSATNPVFEQGDPGLAGDATVSVDVRTGMVCVNDLDIELGGDAATGLHIHTGRVDQTGPVIVAFDVADALAGESCVEVDGAVVDGIVAEPQAHYLNLHTDAYAAGIARGQLVADLTTSLSGEAEVADGDPDGSGFARVFRPSDSNPDVVCASFTVADLDPITAAHVHAGEAGSDGAVVATIGDYGDPGTGDMGEAITTDFGCQTDVGAADGTLVFDDPAGHYVNVHTEAYPAGAVRGQLG